MTSKYVFILSDTRTGSTVFSEALAAALGCESLGEVFNPLGISHVADMPISSVFKQLPDTPFVAKIMYHDLHLGHPVQSRIAGRPLLLVELYKMWPNAVIVHLTRKSWIHAAYSEYRATRTGHFHELGNKRSDFKVSDALEGTPEILEVAGSRRVASQLVRGYLSQFSGIRWLEVDYAELGTACLNERLSTALGRNLNLKLAYNKLVTAAEITQFLQELANFHRSQPLRTIG